MERCLEFYQFAPIRASDPADPMYEESVQDKLGVLCGGCEGVKETWEA